MAARRILPGGLVTFLFTDIEGSTRLAQLLGPRYRSVLHEHRRLVRRSCRGTGGVELFTEGDSHFFAFPDGAAALTAARTAQLALTGHAWPVGHPPPRVRMGLHSGRVRPRGGEYASPEVHRAARIAAAAHGGQVLCSAATAASVGDRLAAPARLRDLGLFRLRGFDGRERLFQLLAPGLPAHFPRPRAGCDPNHNLPAPVSSFVGRVDERVRLARLLAAHRLVTVVGAPGVGKSRLAVEVAADLTDTYPDGVWFTDVADVTDPGHLADTLARELGLRPEPGRPVHRTLADHVADRRLLLLLDTCDAQPAVVTSLVSDLLAAGRAARVLATGRQPLGLAGEVVWRLPPLSPVPTGGQPGEAVRLLVDRATTARGGVAPAPAERPALARVATRLAGSPLAIELAANRLRVLGAARLADRLADGDTGLLEVLDSDPPTGPAAPARPPVPAGRRRHTGLRASVEWSYRSLPPGPARLLREMSVFAGPVGLAAVRRLFGRDPLAAVTELVERSLLEVEPPTDGSVAGCATGPAMPGRVGDHDRTYRLREPVRAFAARTLAEAGETAAARERHLEWTIDALRWATGPTGRSGTPPLHRLDPLVDEARAALRWSVTDGSAAAGLRVLVESGRWWRERGPAGEGRRWFARLYRRMAATGERVDRRLFAEAYLAHGWWTASCRAVAAARPGQAMVQVSPAVSSPASCSSGVPVVSARADSTCS